MKRGYQIDTTVIDSFQTLGLDRSSIIVEMECAGLVEYGIDTVGSHEGPMIG